MVAATTSTSGSSKPKPSRPTREEIASRVAGAGGRRRPDRREECSRSFGPDPMSASSNLPLITIFNQAVAPRRRRRHHNKQKVGFDSGCVELEPHAGWLFVIILAVEQLVQLDRGGELQLSTDDRQLGRSAPWNTSSGGNNCVRRFAAKCGTCQRSANSSPAGTVVKCDLCTQVPKFSRVADHVLLVTELPPWRIG